MSVAETSSKRASKKPTRQQPSLSTMAKRRAAEDAKLRAMLATIEAQQRELAERAARIREMLGETEGITGATAERINGHAAPQSAFWQCFDCDGKFGRVEGEPMPKECPLCHVSPFEQHA